VDHPNFLDERFELQNIITALRLAGDQSLAISGR